MNFGYEIYRNAFVVIVAVALALVTYRIVAAPNRPASPLGMRGLKRQRTIDQSPAWSQLEPIVRFLGVRVGSFLDDAFRKRLDQQLSLAGDYLGMTADEYIALSLITFVLGLGSGGLAALITGSGLFWLAVLGPFGAAVPYLLVTEEVQRRHKQINHGLPYVIDLMALAMSAGQDFPGAVRQVVEKSSNPDDALVEEMTLILHELQVGKTRKQALLDFATRAPLEAVNEFVAAIVQAEERGNPVADVLQIQAGVARTRRSVRAEEAAAKAGVAMAAPLFLLFFSIMLLVMGPLILEISKTQ